MIADFYNTYFNQPGGYTTVETIVFALILAAAVFLIYKYILKKLPLEIDRNFLIALLPYVIFGGMFRVLGPDDAELYTGFLFHTPGIYVFMFVITLTALLLSIALQKITGKEYKLWMLAFGTLLILLTAYQLSTYGIENSRGFFMITGLTLLLSAALYPVTVFKPEYLNKINHLILSGHILDGTSTYIATAYFGYVEKHVLPGFLIDVFGPWIMLPLKIGVVWLVLYYLDRIVEDRELLTWIRLVILVLGLGLGVRNVTLVTLAI